MTSEQRSAALSVAVLAIGALVLMTRRRVKPSHGWQPAPQLPPPAGVYVRVPNGWRRATDSEVTPHMQAAARNALSASLGSLLGPFTGEGGVTYLVAVETHSNAPKGASILLPA